MHHLPLLFLLYAVSLLSACAGSPVAIAQAKPEELKQYSNAQLCGAYYHAGRPAAVKAEIELRGFIKPELWPTIEQEKVRVGMPEAALYCAWGNPDDVNTRVSASGERKQIIYKRGRSSRQYVYTTNGVVESTSSN